MPAYFLKMTLFVFNDGRCVNGSAGLFLDVGVTCVTCPGKLKAWMEQKERGKKTRTRTREDKNWSIISTRDSVSFCFIPCPHSSGHC